MMKNFSRLLWYFFCKYILFLISDRNFILISSFLSYKRLGFRYSKYNLSNPQSFNEKLNVLKLDKINENLWKYADKIEVRKYIQHTIGQQYLVPLLGIYNNADEIDFENLPNQFAMKTNHGSGWNVICKNKGALNIRATARMFNRWLTFNAFYLSREYQYKPIQPAILCEEMLQYNIYDYKFFCFDGEPQIVQLDIDRFTNHKRAFYNMYWEKQNFSIRYKISEKHIEKPKQWEEMKSIARQLATPFRFVRVDLYIHAGHIYFGELTFFPGGGNEPFNPVEADFEFGKYLKL